MKQLVSPKQYKGTITIPPSKSDTQRAILIAALGMGESFVRNCGKSRDESAMMNAVIQLGAEVKWFSDTVVSIKGISNLDQKKVLSMGESGLGFRLMAVVAAVFDQEITLEAEGSLVNRPMHFLDEVLPKLQVTIESNHGFAPLKIKGPLIGSSLTVDGSLSSQFLSGLLIALPFSAKNSKIVVKDLKSIPYVEMTLSSLRKFGIEITHNRLEEFDIQGNQQVKETDYHVEGDWSSASYWLVASALGLAISVQNLSLESLQADKAILEVFRLANCVILNQDGLLKIDGSKRKPFNFDATHCPDLFPALSVFGAMTEGESKIKGIHRLIYKESNRAEAIQLEFKKLGIRTQISNDELIIHGKKSVRGGAVDAHNDHRIAMSLAILGMFSETALTIEGAEAVSKSYPDFWKDLESLT